MQSSTGSLPADIDGKNCDVVKNQDGGFETAAKKQPFPLGYFN